MAQTINQVRAALASPKTGQVFSAGFAEVYFARAFGSLPKSELDLLVFSLLMESGVLTRDHSLFEIARTLNVTPAKARNLLFQHQLRTVQAKDLDNDVLIEVLTAKFGLDGGRIGFGVESPLIRAAIQAKAKNKRVFPDISLSGEVLYVPANQIGDFISAFLPPDKAKALVDRLRRKGVVDPDDITQALNKIGAAMTKGAGSAAGKVAGEKLGDVLFCFIKDLTGGADVDVPEVLGTIMQQN